MNVTRLFPNLKLRTTLDESKRRGSNIKSLQHCFRPSPSNPTSNPKTDIMLEDVPERNNVGFDVACVLDGNNKNIR